MPNPRSTSRWPRKSRTRVLRRAANRLPTHRILLSVALVSTSSLLGSTALGQPVTVIPTFPVTTPAGGYITDHDVEGGSGRFVVSWDNYGEVRAKSFLGDGTPQGPEIVVAGSNADYSAVALDPSGDFVVVWLQDPQYVDYYFTTSDLRIRKFTAGGSPQSGASVLGSAYSGSPPDVTSTSAGEFVVAWNAFAGSSSYYYSYYPYYLGSTIANCTVLGQRVDGAGSPSGASFNIGTPGTGTCDSPSVDTEGSLDFVVSWRSCDFGPCPAYTAYGPPPLPSTVRAGVLSATGDPLTPTWSIGSPSFYGGQQAVVAGSDLRFTVVWESDYQLLASRYDEINAVLLGPISIGSTDPGYRLTVDGSGPDFVVSWLDGSTFRARAGAGNDAGLVLGSAPALATASSSYGEVQIAGIGEGSYVVAWNDYPSGIKAQVVALPTLRAVEVNQVLQDWHNSIPLIAKKTTLVRAHFEIPLLSSHNAIPSPFRACLQGFELQPGGPGGYTPAEFSDSMRTASNFGGEARAVDDAAEQRPFDRKTLNFDLPEAWTATGNPVALRVVPVPLEQSCGAAAKPPFDQAIPGIICAEPENRDRDGLPSFLGQGGSANDCATVAHFVDVTRSGTTLVPVKFQPSSGEIALASSTISDLEKRLRSRLPVADKDSSKAWTVLKSDPITVAPVCASQSNCVAFPDLDILFGPVVLPGLATDLRARLLLRLMEMREKRDGRDTYVGVYPTAPGVSGEGWPLPDDVAVGGAGASSSDFHADQFIHEYLHTRGIRHPVAGPPETIVGQPGPMKRGFCGSLAADDTLDFPFVFDLTPQFAASFGPYERIEADGTKGQVADPGNTRPTLGPLRDLDIETPQGFEASEVVFGFDGHPAVRSVLDPRRVFPLISYCGNMDSPATRRWISVPSYLEVFDSLGGAIASAARGPQADELVVSGIVDLGLGTAEILNVGKAVGPATITGTNGSYSLDFRDEQGSPISSASFGLFLPQPDGPELQGSIGVFRVAVPFDPLITEVVLSDLQSQGLGPQSPLASRSNPTPPSVTVLSPNGGEVLGGAGVQVSWLAMDADGDSLTHSVFFSADDGTTWLPLVSETGASALTVSLSDLPGSTSARVRVVSTDGFHVVEDVSDGAFTTPNSPPAVSATLLSDRAEFLGPDAITLRAEVVDAEDGEVSPSGISWSSDLDGFLGSGAELQLSAEALTVGQHVLTAVAVDSGGEQGQDSVGIEIVVDATDTDGDGLPDLIDNCVNRINPGQQDAGGFDSSAPNERGDLCECGDVDANGVVDLVDAVIYLRNEAALLPGLSDPQTCSVVGGPLDCDQSDVDRLREALIGLGEIDLVCDALVGPPAP